MEIRQLEQRLVALERDTDLKRVTDEITRLEKEIASLESKLSGLTEKKRDREEQILKERHDIERQIEEIKVAARGTVK